MLRKKAFTIIELVVAMAIFMIVVTIAVGAFVAVSRTKSLSSTMKESQQKLRVALEMITRLSRQGEKVVISGGGKVLDIYFDLSGTASATQFTINGDEITYRECLTITAKNCTSWGTGIDLLGGVVTLSDTSGFQKIVTNLPPSLKINLNGNIVSPSGSPYFEDSLSIETAVILESLK